MSSSNGTEYYLKSMNGIKSFDDGSGTIIEDDSITIATIECTGNTNSNSITTASMECTGDITCEGSITASRIATASIGCTGNFNTASITAASMECTGDITAASMGCTGDITCASIATAIIGNSGQEMSITSDIYSTKTMAMSKILCNNF